jgi:predicted outer membrane repeat protein
VYVDQTDGDQATEVVVRDSLFTDNFGYDGGGVYVSSGVRGSVLIERTTLSGNRAHNSGAGIAFFGPGDAQDPVTIADSTVAGNTADIAGQGGGIALFTNESPAAIRNTTISGNHSSIGGGGLTVDTDGATVTIANSTIAGNSADESGGALYAGDPVVLRSSIVAGNIAPQGPDIFAFEDPDLSAGFSLIGNTTGVTLTEDPAGSNIVGADPQLGPLASNGGPTQTRLPALTSPAIDKGIANGLAADQRGLARTGDLSLFANAAGGDATDIGAVEIQAADCQGQGSLKIDGTEGDDALTGTDGPDAITALGGADTVNAAGGDDCVSGAGGKDRLSGAAGEDQLKGDAGRDNLKGGGGKDRVSGAGGKDKLSGGGGKDRLKGGPGKDTLKGGGGKDRFNCGGGEDKVTAQPKDKVAASCENVVEKR